MKSVAAIVLVYVAFCLVQGMPEEKDGKKGHGHHGPMTCLGSNLTYTDAFKKANETCSKTKIADDADKDKKMNAMLCRKVCIGQGMGMLDTAGKPVKDKLAAVLKDMFPEAALKNLTTELTSCIDKNEKSLVLKDGECGTYEEMMGCAFKGIMKACKSQ